MTPLMRTPEWSNSERQKVGMVIVRDQERPERGVLLNGYRVSHFHDEKTSGNWLHGIVNILHITEPCLLNG